MKLTLKNIAGISSANLELKGITVIAGENSTGKSTVGKSIYSLLHGISTPVSEFRKSIILYLRSIFSNELRFYIRRINFYKAQGEQLNSFIEDNIISNDFFYSIRKDTKASELLSKTPEQIAELFFKYISDLRADSPGDGLHSGRKFRDTGNIDSIFEDKELERKIFNELVLELNRLKDITFRSFIEEKVRASFAAEFNSQIVNFNCNDFASVKLVLDYGDSAEYKFFVDGSDKFLYEGDNLYLYDNSLKTQSPIFIDTPLVLDYLQQQAERYSRFLSSSDFDKENHLQFLIQLLNNEEGNSPTVEKILTVKRLKEVIDRITGFYEGTIRRKNAGFFVSSDKFGEKQLKISNLSSGLKIFAILKQLIMNGSIKNTSFLIFDEPEIHEHPKWQIVLAEIVVLIHKYLGIHVVITSHSPYFIEAMEVYSKKYELEENTLFYLSKKTIKGNFVFEDKTNDKEAIYKLLLEPFQELENESSRLLKSDES